jgi:hypothetical protein
MKHLILVCAFALSTTVLSAQVGTPTNHLAWDQGGPDLATVQSYSYNLYPDAVAVPTILTSVTCSGTASPFTCTVAFPTFTPGSHTLTVTAVDAAGESAKASPSLSFQFVVIPLAPVRLRVTP